MGESGAKALDSAVLWPWLLGSLCFLALFSIDRQGGFQWMSDEGGESRPG
jgi:hypothetical protein